MPYNFKGKKEPGKPFVPDFLRVKRFGSLVIFSWLEEPTPASGSMLSNAWKSRTVTF